MTDMSTPKAEAASSAERGDAMRRAPHPANGQVAWVYGLTLDPYGLHPTRKGIAANRTGMLRAFTRKRDMGLVW